MSVSFTASGPAFDRAGWRAKVLDELKDEAAGWNPLPHTGRLTEGEEWKLLIEGSVRGVGVSPGEDGEEILINSMASRRDWELAYRIMRLALKKGAELRDEEGAEIREEDLSSDAAVEGFAERWEFGRGVLASLVKDGKKATLGCGLFSLEITGADLDLGDAELEAELASRVRKYGRAHPASVMVLQSEDGKHEISTANYGQIATLIPDEATHITFGAPGNEAIDGLVPADEFRRVFGELVEPAGVRGYVPGVDFDDEPVILKALREKATDAEKALGSAPAPVLHRHGESISEEEWEVLEKGPALVFLTVAASDGKVGKRETTTFAKVIVGASHLEAECPSLGRALGASLEKVPEVIAEIEAADEFDTAGELRKIGETVEACLSEDEGQNYKLGLLYIGKEVAEAEGGFFGMGRRINEGEASALKMIADAFGIGLEEE